MHSVSNVIVHNCVELWIRVSSYRDLAEDKVSEESKSNFAEEERESTKEELMGIIE